jgi:hypothetical protein
MKQLYLLFFFLIFQSLLYSANDKYRLIITDDPATTMTIGWNQISGHSVAVFFDIVDHGTDFQEYANFQLPDRTAVFKGMNNYFVRLKGLVPNTAYYFVIVAVRVLANAFGSKPCRIIRSSLYPSSPEETPGVPALKQHLMNPASSLT